MAKKEDLLSKFNIKDYNNQLEEVLETKNFSSDVKNFLLSMLYKIEIAYNDYLIVKNITKTKSEFLTEIIETIKNNCDKIELVKPSDKEYEKIINTKEKCVVNHKEKAVTSLYNEKTMLYAISKLKTNEYEFKNDVTKEPLEILFSNGENISISEIIRDFDGWSWNIEEKQIEDINYNIVFQTITFLIGKNINTEQEIKRELNKIYDNKIGEYIYILLCKIAILLYINDNNNQRKLYQHKKKEMKKELEEMENKAEYVKQITEKRKNAEAKLKDIKKCLTNVKTLEKEYSKINGKLATEKKITNVKDFAKYLAEEEKDIVLKLKEYNEKMKPKNYITKKEYLTENLKILDVLGSKKDVYYYILQLQKKFIDGLQWKIGKAETRKDIMSIIYILRYYKCLPYQGKQVKDIQELKDGIYETEEMIYNFACKMNVLNSISINNKVNTDVIREILNTKVIELENIELLFEAKNYQIELKIFDEENIERVLEYDTIEGLTARMNKRFRMFIK